jgi:HSP20 family molecular chaperone IbpA|tara:strand:- start:3829 stop:4200 length:372 start_codon:yes stop_codon:yes gene_type:complete
MWGRRDKDMLDMWVDLLNQIEELPSKPNMNPLRHRNDVSVNTENGTVTITAELAGLDKEQVDVEVSNRAVTIVANSDRKNFKWEETFKYELDPESTKATMVNGILDLSIEKKEKTSAKKIEIE